MSNQQDSAAALKHLQSALFEDSPALATMDALQFKARVHEKLGQLKEAIHTLQTALEADPAARDVLEHLVRLELRAGLKEAALDHLRRYTVAAGKDLSHLVKAAELHYELKRHDDAHEVANRACELGSQAKAERILGLIHWHKREYRETVVHLDRGDSDAKALEVLIQGAFLHPGRPRCRPAAGAEMIRRLEDAGAELFALEKDILLLANRRDKLLTQWQVPKGQQLAARHIVNRFLCAERALAEHWPRGEADRLSMESMEGLAFGPQLALQAWLSLEKGQLRKAAADAQMALQLQPDEYRAHLVRGRVRLEQGNSDAALIDLLKATEAEPP